MLRLLRTGVWVPLVVTLGILALDLLEGPKTQYVGLLVAMPFVAAALVGSGATLAVGAAVLGLAFGFGFLQAGDGVGGHGPTAAFTVPQLTRLAFISAAVAGAVVLARVRLRREERLRNLAAVAAVAQLAIMRPVQPRVGTVRCTVRYVSASHEAQLGGDLVEVLDSPFGVRAVIGDVRGKGLDGVRMAAQVLGSFRERAVDTPDLSALALALDASVRRNAGPEDFVTALLLQIEAGGTTLAVSCGHPSPFVVAGTADRADAVTALVTEPHHPPLGMLWGLPPQPVVCRLQPGDRLVAVTDGLLEARRDGHFFDATAALVLAMAGRGLDEGADALMTALEAFADGRLADDVAVLALEFSGALEPSCGPGRPVPVG